MDNIRLHDKIFRPFIPNSQIESVIDEVAKKLDADFCGSGEVPVLLCVLNGAIMFTAGLMKRISFHAELVSMKLSSYSGTQSTGKVLEVMGLTGDVKGRTVIVCEDIVDTGGTIVALRQLLLDKGAKEVRVCTMLLKPEVYAQDIALDYVGMEIPNVFIVGYGLDYDELGRNLKDIYVLDRQADMKYYIIFGPPGAGKGTQAAPLAKRYNLKHLSTGELLRSEIAGGTELGLRAKALIEAGKLVPDVVVEGMIAQAFGKYRDVDGFLLDGFPRTVAQAVDLDEMLEARGEGVTAVISLMIPDSEIKKRIAHRAELEGRADDARDSVVQNRIDTYHAQTEPLIQIYKEKGIYHEVDSMGAIDEVAAGINALMDSLG